jgi:hypothetical protein
MKSCTYCKKKTEHAPGCPENYASSMTLDVAVRIYNRGFQAGRTGKPADEKDVTYQLGYRQGRIEFNDGRD